MLYSMNLVSWGSDHWYYLLYTFICNKNLKNLSLSTFKTFLAIFLGNLISQGPCKILIKKINMSNLKNAIPGMKKAK